MSHTLWAQMQNSNLSETNGYFYCLVLRIQQWSARKLISTVMQSRLFVHEVVSNICTRFDTIIEIQILVNICALVLLLLRNIHFKIFNLASVYELYTF
jgi:hypothetical protein